MPPPAGALVSEDQAANDSLRVTGESTYPGVHGLLVQRPVDARRHTHLVGPTGSGKSTLIGNLALADITAGRGVVLVDMKGDLAMALADRIPNDHLDDVVLLDPSSPVPVGRNVLRAGEPDLTVDTIIHVMQELYASAWGPRTADVMLNGLQTLVRHGGLTLVELPVLLQNPNFRRQVLQRIGRDDLGVGPFWQSFESLSDAERATVIGPSLNKLRAFTNRELTRRVLGQVSGFDLRKVFTERKTLLVNLSKGRLGSESARLFGSLLVGSLWSIIQQRDAIPEDRRPTVIVYLDEFQQLLKRDWEGRALARWRW